MDASTSAKIAGALLDWYDAHARTLPWRRPPGQPLPQDDPHWPYRVWLSEVMLQQTTVAAVMPYFARFTARWPTVADLAAADESEVMAAWAGLGYYARARNLIACARAVVARGGAFPDDEVGLRALPGFGVYTAAAVAAIGFGRRAVVVDANVERVASRLFAIAQPLPGAKPTIRTAVDAITPALRGGDFAQAMMDLGATICTTRMPRCLLCPLRPYCAAQATGQAQAYPVKAPRRARPERHGQAYWIMRDSAVWLVRRAGRGMLGGMRALPDDGWHAGADGAAAPPLAGPWQVIGEVSHVFTHFTLRLELALYSGYDWPSLALQDGEWWPLDRLQEAGLPTLFARAARLVTKNRTEEG